MRPKQERQTNEKLYAKCKILLLVAVAISLAAIVGRMEKQDLELRNKAYCRNVANSTWPDFERNYEKLCK